MADLSTLIEQAKAELSSDLSNDIFLIDPNTRKITVPSTESLFGATNDKDAERKYFIVPKIVGDDVDLSSTTAYIYYKNASGVTGFYQATDLTASGDYVRFSWLVGRAVVSTSGNISFSVAFKKIVDNSTITMFNSAIASGTVIDSLYSDSTDSESIDYEEASTKLDEILAKQSELSTSISQLNEDLTQKVGYAEYEESYLYLYESSEKQTLIAKLLIEGGSTEGGISEAKCKEIVESYGYAVADNLSTVATSGSYNDLANKPTIPSATTVTQTLTSGTEIGAVNGTKLYAPSGSGGGSTVSADQVLTEGTEIGGVTIDGTRTAFFAPSGGSGSSWVDNGFTLLETISLEETVNRFSTSNTFTFTPHEVMIKINPLTVDMTMWFAIGKNGVATQSESNNIVAEYISHTKGTTYYWDLMPIGDSLKYARICGESSRFNFNPDTKNKLTFVSGDNVTVWSQSGFQSGDSVSIWYR